MEISNSSLPVLALDDGVATITINRPQQKNRLEDCDLREILIQIKNLNDDRSVRVVVFTSNVQGQGRSIFSSGYHIGGFEEEGSKPELFSNIPDAIAAMRPVTVCALNGNVYGGATDILMACDIGIAIEGAELRMPAVALGLHYYPSGLKRYISKLGQSMTLRAFLTAEAIPVETLQKIGFLTAVFPAETWLEDVGRKVLEIRDMAPLAAQLTKRSILEISSGKYDIDLIREREVLTVSSLDFAEGRKAFLEKRLPNFIGF